MIISVNTVIFHICSHNISKTLLTYLSARFPFLLCHYTAVFHPLDGLSFTYLPFPLFLFSYKFIPYELRRTVLCCLLPTVLIRISNATYCNKQPKPL